MAWPPPVAPEEPWRTITLTNRGGKSNVRPVQLWGRTELINEAGDVLCGCGRLVPIDVLCTPGNGHINSPVASAEPRLLRIQEMVAASQEPEGSRAVFL